MKEREMEVVKAADALDDPEKMWMKLKVDLMIG